MYMANAAELISTDATPGDMVPQPYTITAQRKDTYDTFTLDMVAGDGKPVMAFAPGQFNMLYAFGVGEVPISISGDPTTNDRLVQTVREVGSVTSALRRLRKGDTVGVRGPFGTAWPVKEAEGSDLVILAGGIGIAPLRPVIYSALKRRRKFGRFVIMYGSRTPHDLLYYRELQQWKARYDIEVEITVDRAIGPWRGNVGVVTTLIPRVKFDPLSAIVMVCGPEIMMRFGIMELRRANVPEDNIYISMERNMKCGCGLCGHCQCGPLFVCKDGPVFRYLQMKRLLNIREI